MLHQIGMYAMLYLTHPLPCKREDNQTFIYMSSISNQINNEFYLITLSGKVFKIKANSLLNKGGGTVFIRKSFYLDNAKNRSTAERTYFPSLYSAFHYIL